MNGKKGKDNRGRPLWEPTEMLTAVRNDLIRKIVNNQKISKADYRELFKNSVKIISLETPPKKLDGEYSSPEDDE